jgi:hypothetical protein
MPTYIRQVDDSDGTLKLALKFDLEPEQVAVLTRGVDPGDQLDYCCRYVWNFLQANSVQALRRHLEFLVRSEGKHAPGA